MEILRKRDIEEFKNMPEKLLILPDLQKMP